MRSPNSPLIVNLPSFIHYSIRLNLFCWITGFASSTDSMAFSFDYLSNASKQIKMGGGPPVEGRFLNLLIVSIFLKSVPGASLATAAAPAQSLAASFQLNWSMKRSSAPDNPNRLARLNDKFVLPGIWAAELTQGTRLFSSTLIINI